MRISDWSSDVCSSDLAPVQFVLGGPTYELLDAWSDRIVERALQNPNLLGVDKNYKPTRPEIRVEIERNRAADQIRNASWRDRVCQYASTSVVAGPLKKTVNNTRHRQLT